MLLLRVLFCLQGWFTDYNHMSRDSKKLFLVKYSNHLHEQFIILCGFGLEDLDKNTSTTNHNIKHRQELESIVPALKKKNSNARVSITRELKFSSQWINFRFRYLILFCLKAASRTVEIQGHLLGNRE